MFLSGHRRWTSRGVVIVLAIAIVGAVVVILRTTTQKQAAPPRISQQIAVPAYMDPTVNAAAWNELVNSTRGTVGFVVANVLNGPADQPYSSWASVIQSTYSRGIKVLGYVDTGYLGTTGQRTRTGSTSTADWITQIEHDVNAWYQFYGSDIGGIFFDKAQNMCGPSSGSNAWADQYAELSAYVKKNYPGALTVANPGTAVPQCYESAADSLVTFEGSYRAYTSSSASTPDPYRALTWSSTDPEKIWHIVYAVPSTADMQQVLNLSKTRKAGFVFVTDATLPNPYDTLPQYGYWLDEEHRVGRPDPEKPKTP